jgi:hypothetical protein
MLQQLFARVITATALLHNACGEWVMQQLQRAAKEVPAARFVAEAVAQAVAPA